MCVRGCERSESDFIFPQADLELPLFKAIIKCTNPEIQSTCLPFYQLPTTAHKFTHVTYYYLIIDQNQGT